MRHCFSRGVTYKQMPRVTPNQYLDRRRELAAIGQHATHDYAYLTSAEQRAIHDYYCPTEALSDGYALQYRHEAGWRHSPLPHLAGRAYAKLVGIRAGTVPVPAPQTRYVVAGRGDTRGRAITVRAVLRPQPDIQGIVRALMSLKPEDLDAMVQRMKDDKPKF